MEKIFKPFIMFEFNNTRYCIIAVNGFLHFFKYIGTSLSENLTTDEVELISEVYSKIKINKKTSFPIKTINLDGKIFEIWYDLTSTLHFWYEIKDGNRCKSSREDNKILNIKYNYVSDVIYTTLQDERDKLWQQYQGAIEHLNRIEQKNKINKTINRISNIVIVACACIITCRACGDILEFSDLPIAKRYRESVRHYEQLQFESQYSDAIEELKEKLGSQEYKWENIKQSIELNDNLGDDEKELLLKLKFYFDENHKYMDIDTITERLAKLKIKYDSNSVKDNVYGQYSKSKNQITMFGCGGFGEIEFRSFMHEVLHVFQVIKDDSIIIEVSNEAALRELTRKMMELGLIDEKYMNEFKDDDGLITKFGTGYSRIMPPEYCLLELLPQEDIKLYQFNTDERIIVTALKEIESQGQQFEPYSKEEKEIYTRAINLVDTYNCFYDENRNIVLSSAVDNELYQQLDEYYKIKNGISMREICSADTMYSDYDEMKSRNAFDDRNTALQKTMGIASDEIDRESEIFFSYNLHVIPRTYFSDDHPYPIITYKDISQEIRAVEITEEVDVLFQEICDEYGIDVSKNYSIYKQQETQPINAESCEDTQVKHSGKLDYISKGTIREEDR